MQRILVTGANKGIGFAIATRILEEHPQAFVYLGSRDKSRGDAAKEKLLGAVEGAENRVEVVELDVGSDASVEKAQKQVAESLAGEKLYGIVNNAGIGSSGASLQQVLNVNAYGIYRVTTAFRALLSDKGRVVNVTSAAGPNFVAKCSAEQQAFFTNQDVTWEALAKLMAESTPLDGDASAFQARGLGSGEAYGFSKAVANGLTIHLARENPSLRINACTPGFIATDMTAGFGSRGGKSLAEMGAKPPREGATSTLFLLFGEPEGNGRYYGSDAKRSPLDRYRSPGSAPYTGD